MNGKDIFVGLKYIGADLVQEAECDAFPAQETARPRRPRRMLLIAALVAMMLLLVGCGVAVLMKMQDVKIADATDQREYIRQDGIYVEVPHTVNTSTLSLSGLKGSKAYQASADFYAFQSAYKAEIDQMAQNGTLPKEFGEKDEYLNTLAAKAEELAQQYGLKPEGETLDFRTTRNLCDALGVERFVRDSEEIHADVSGGGCQENGNFQLSMQFQFPSGKGYEVEHTTGVLRWNWQDCFSRDYITIEDSGDWVEKNYTTASGQEVLILYTPSQEYGYILCDRGNALMSLQLTVNPEIYSEKDGVVSSKFLHLTERQLELIADSLEFAINPRILTQADVDAQPAPSQEATQNGYTVTVKSVETDGYAVKIRVGITAPEGVSLPVEQGICFSNLDFLVSQIKPAFADRSISSVEDGDGKANTLDLVIESNATLVDGQPPYGKGSTWNLHIIDIIYSTVSQDWGHMVETTVAEGEWNIPITFDDTNGDYRELELITQPIQAKGCTGWYEDGTDAVDTLTLTSYKLRKFSNSSEIVSDPNAPAGADFDRFNGSSTKVVLKDGTAIELGEQPLDLDQVDHVILADGTKLPVPQE